MILSEWLKTKVYNAFLGQTICCLGDSHVKAFERVGARGGWTKTRFQLCVVPGASAQGLVNPNSKTNAMDIFGHFLRKVPSSSHLLFCLGEVDCGFVIWYRAKKHGISVEEQFRTSLSNYQGFVIQVARQGYQSIMILSTPLPTIQDDQDWGDVASLRMEQLTRMQVEAGLLERTRLTQAYNAEMRSFCSENNFTFIDLETPMMDVQTGVIRKEFLNTDPLDHHHDYDRTSDLLIKDIKALGFC